MRISVQNHAKTMQKHPETVGNRIQTPWGVLRKCTQTNLTLADAMRTTVEQGFDFPMPFQRFGVVWGAQSVLSFVLEVGQAGFGCGGRRREMSTCRILLCIVFDAYPKFSRMFSNFVRALELAYYHLSTRPDVRDTGWRRKIRKKTHPKSRFFGLLQEV